PQGMRQYAPFPFDLAALVASVEYRPGWTIKLVDVERDPADTHGHSAGGLTLRITTCGYNSYHPDHGETYRVHHYSIVPAATYNRARWLRWLFEQFLLVERHEAMEFFKLAVGNHFEEDTSVSVQYERPFAPTHGPGMDPYIVHEAASAIQTATSFRGEINPTEEDAGE
ncbi:MAG: hypothetical protein JWO62_3347, partial [Acidimicrobiaceae bacterium]|nr:hypothetical protein [Acidimicrobiaceae bacterium]